MPVPHPLFTRPDSASSREFTKTVLIGQAPSKRGIEVDRAPLGGPVGDKLMGVLGCDLKAYVRGYRRLNLVWRYPGRRYQGAGDEFPAAMASLAWGVLAPNLVNRRFILLGAKVADVATNRMWRARGWLTAMVHPQIAGSAYLVVPHPSGLNRWWNAPENIAAAKSALRAFCAEGPHA